MWELKTNLEKTEYVIVGREEASNLEWPNRNGKKGESELSKNQNVAYSEINRSQEKLKLEIKLTINVRMNSNLLETESK